MKQVTVVGAICCYFYPAATYQYHSSLSRSTTECRPLGRPRYALLIHLRKHGTIRRRHAVMGRRQVVRHQVLVLAFGGSNPSGPAKLSLLPAFCRLVICFIATLFGISVRLHPHSGFTSLICISSSVFYFSDKSKLIGLRYFNLTLKSNTLENTNYSGAPRRVWRKCGN